MGTLKEEQDYDFAAFFILGVFDRTGTVLFSESTVMLLFSRFSLYSFIVPLKLYLLTSSVFLVK